MEKGERGESRGIAFVTTVGETQPVASEMHTSDDETESEEKKAIRGAGVQ